MDIDDILYPTIEGGTIPDVIRCRTGLFSLDLALSHAGELGFPLRNIIELYGNEHIGKSSLAYWMAASVREDGRVGIMDTEGALSKDYLRQHFARAGFHGVVKVVDSAKKDKKGNLVPRQHSEMGTELADYLTQNEFNAVILDSIGMWIPPAEAAGDIGDANMGRRAQNIAQLVRRAASHLIVYHTPPKAVILVNHSLQSFGVGGHYSPGGKTKNFARGVALYMYVNDRQFPYGCWQIEVRVEKLRVGGTYKERIGQVFFIPAFGVAPHMTAVMDCFRLKLANRTGGWVRYKEGDEWVVVGRMAELIEAEMEGNTEIFEPFHALLRDYEKQLLEDNDGQEADRGDDDGSDKVQDEGIGDRQGPDES